MAPWELCEVNRAVEMKSWRAAGPVLCEALEQERTSIFVPMGGLRILKYDFMREQDDGGKVFKHKTEKFAELVFRRVGQVEVQLCCFKSRPGELRFEATVGTEAAEFKMPEKSTVGMMKKAMKAALVKQNLASPATHISIHTMADDVSNNMKLLKTVFKCPYEDVNKDVRKTIQNMFYKKK